MIKKVSALELFQRETTCTNRIKTLCRKLDKMLCGGIIIGKGIIELCGIPGSGKTQLCKQLSINIQIPKSIGGPGLNAIYIDTEGNFNKNRLREISVNTINYIKSKSKDENITIENLVENVRYIRIFDLDELIYLLSALPDICKQNKIGLIIIDSISMLIRICNLNNQPYRLRMQHKVAKILENMSKEYSLSIIVTNHMTTKYIESNQMKKENLNVNFRVEDKNLEPSLGISWNSLIYERLLLKPEKNLINENEASNIVSLKNSYGEVVLFEVRDKNLYNISIIEFTIL